MQILKTGTRTHQLSLLANYWIWNRQRCSDSYRRTPWPSTDSTWRSRILRI